MVSTTLKQLASIAFVACMSIGVAHATEPAVAPDNSAKNVRDRSAHELTAADQSNEKHDLETARKIRERITSDSSMSTYAKNIKIIVTEKMITLKGPVKTEAEKGKILKVASGLGHGYKIENEMQVTK